LLLFLLSNYKANIQKFDKSQVFFLFIYQFLVNGIDREKLFDISNQFKQIFKSLVFCFFANKNVRIFINRLGAFYSRICFFFEVKILFLSYIDFLKGVFNIPLIFF